MDAHSRSTVGKNIDHDEPDPKCMEVQELLAGVEVASFAELL